MSENKRFTDHEKADCAKRELAYRRKVFARRVMVQTMTQDEADREIALMQEIFDDYREKTELPL